MMPDSASPSHPRRVRPKYQVFVSSTYEDLHEERQSVTWEILKARHIPAGMENFSANPDRGWNIIKQTIDVSDYYIVIVAGQYGSIDVDTGLSWTELEYDYAVSKSLAVLAFVRSDGSITADRIERDPERQRKLEAFILKLRAKHHCETWDATADLCAKVSQALAKSILDDQDGANPPPGWYRGTAVPSPESMEEFFRLSAENKRLQDLLASHEPAKPRLLIRCAGKELMAREFTTTRERLELEIFPKAAMVYVQPTMSYVPVSKDSQLAFAEQCNSALLVELEVANDGEAPARNVVIDLDCDNTKEVALNGLEPPRERVVASIGRLPWWMDPVGHVYVDSHSVADGHGGVRQRIKLVGVGSSEPLVPVVFVLGGDKDANERRACLKCTVTSEDGSRTSAEFHYEIKYAGTKRVSWKALTETKTA